MIIKLYSHIISIFIILNHLNYLISAEGLCEKLNDNCIREVFQYLDYEILLKMRLLDKKIFKLWHKLSLNKGFMCLA